MSARSRRKRAGPRPAATLAVLVLAANVGAALLVPGCAKKGPPSGGPPDLTPPRVIGASPDSGKAGVPRTASISLTFSEGMEPRSTSEAISLAPRVDIRQKRWSGRVLTLVLAESLRAHQTYTMFVGEGARDRHGNDMVGGYAVVFSTADSFPRGRIEGRINAAGFDPGGTYLWCYDAAAGRVPDSTAKDFDAVGVAGPNGEFRIDGLAVPGSYRVWAFADLNGNHSLEPQSDVLAAVDTVFHLVPEHPTARGIVLRVVNPRAPGRIKGAVLDTLQDSVGIVRVLAVADTDSTRRSVFEVEAKGVFDIQLAPGRWHLTAFRDLDKNRFWRVEVEPASATLPIDLEPAAVIDNVVLVLRRARGVP